MNVVSDKYNYTLKPKATKTWNDSKNIKKEYNDLKSFHMIIGQDDYEKLLSSGVNDTIAQRTAWVKVTHRINIDLAEKFNLDYERISRK